MTVIAYDGRYVAADKQSNEHSTISTCTKLFQIGAKVCAPTGHAGHGMMLLAWFKDGADPASFPAVYEKQNAFLYVFEYGRPVLSYENYPVPVAVEDGKFAWGSGGDYAIGALAVGANAMEAVEVACRYNTYCGRGMTVFDLKELAGAAGEPVRPTPTLAPRAVPARAKHTSGWVE